MSFFYDEWIQEKRDGLLGQLFALGAIVTGKVSVDDEARENTAIKCVHGVDSFFCSGHIIGFLCAVQVTYIFRILHLYMYRYMKN